MKPTLNEEIGMSKQGIDYVNSLEVKDPIKLRPEFPKDRIENQRIKKEARNNLIFVAIVLIIVLIVNWKS
jgi:hypothetical protein